MAKKTPQETLLLVRIPGGSSGLGVFQRAVEEMDTGAGDLDMPITPDVGEWLFDAARIARSLSDAIDAGFVREVEDVEAKRAYRDQALKEVRAAFSHKVVKNPGVAYGAAVFVREWIDLMTDRGVPYAAGGTPEEREARGLALQRVVMRQLRDDLLYGGLVDWDDVAVS